MIGDLSVAYAEISRYIGFRFFDSRDFQFDLNDQEHRGSVFA